MICGHRSKRDEREGSEHRGLMLWLLVLPPVLLLILFCGQTALLTPMMSARADTQSLLQADYSQWGRMTLSEVKSQIISAIRVDMLSMSYPGAALLGPIQAPGSFLLKPELDSDPHKPVLNRTQAVASVEPTGEFSTTLPEHSQTPSGATDFPDQDPVLTTFPAPPQPDASFWLYNMDTPRQYMMYPQQSSGASASRSVPALFFSEGYTTAAEITSGLSQVYLHVTNISLDSALVTASVYAGDTLAGTGSVDVPARTLIPESTVITVDIDGAWLQPSEVLMVSIVSPAGTRIYWDGQYNDSRVVLPGVRFHESLPASTFTPLPTPSRTQNPAPSSTGTLSQAGTATPVPTMTNTVTRTPTRTSSPSATTTATPGQVSATPTSISSRTASPTASVTFTVSSTSTSTHTATPTEDATGNAYWFSDQTAGTGTYRMYPTPPAGSTGQNIGGSVSFETQDFPGGAAMEAGTTTVYVYATNIFPSGRSMEVTIFRGWSLLGSAQVVVPAQTLAPILIPVSVSTSPTVFQSEGRFLMLDFDLEGGVRIYWAGDEYDESRAVFPGISGP